MAVTWAEKDSGRSGTQGQSEDGALLWIGTSDDPSTDTELTAKSALYSTAPATRGSLVIANAEVSEIEGTGGRKWEGRVTYGPVNFVTNAGDTKLQFSTGGGTQHITWAKEHIATYGTGGTITTPYDGIIGPDGEGGAEGVDIDLAVWEESRTYVFTDAEITTSFLGILFSLTATVNNGTFFYFNAGEAKLRGVDGGQRSDGNWELTFHIAGSPNATSLVVPNGASPITVASKKGWEYMSALYRKKEDTTNFTIGPTIVAVFVDRVYDETDFSLLGIGG